MLYIQHKKGYSEIVFQTFESIIEKSNITVIKRICEVNLFNYNERIKLTKAKLNIKTKTPIYINQQILLIPTKSPRQYDTQWINFFSLLKIVKVNNKTKLIFKNLKTLNLDISYNSFMRSVHHAETIIKHLNDVINESCYSILNNLKR